MHQNVSIKRFMCHAWHLHFMDFFLKKGGTLEQRAITCVRPLFFLEDMVERVQETPRNIRVPTKSSPGGGAGLPPSAPLLLAL